MISRRTLKNLILFSVIMVFITGFFSNNILLPQGWKMPEPNDLKDDWRDDSPDRLAVVHGDFNGDGIKDTARLLVREDGSALGLFAFVSQEDQSLRPYLLDEMDDKGMIQVMGIQKVSPGMYHTACGKGYWACEQGEVPQIEIKNAAIDYFKVESANSFFFLDNRINNFKRIWISD